MHFSINRTTAQIKKKSQFLRGADRRGGGWGPWRGGVAVVAK